MSLLSEEIKIGNITVKNPVCLAPMAGTSSVVYRSICHEFGSAYAPTELSSARSVRFAGIDKGLRYMRIDKAAEGITAIQLFGSDPDDFTEAVKQVCEDPRLSEVDIIDINMGCPVPKVVKTGSGSGLMKDTLNACAVMHAAVRAAEAYGKPVTFKTRIGYDDAHLNGPEFVRAVALEGAAAVCVHGRTATQMYHGQARHDEVARIREAVRDIGIPFFANGDIVDGPTAAAVLEKTGADGIMIGRGAMGNPWIFSNVLSYLNGGTEYEPTAEEKKQMLLRHLDGQCKILPEHIAVREMRSNMPFYLKGMRGGASMRREICMAETVEEVKAVLYKPEEEWEQ